MRLRRRCVSGFGYVVGRKDESSESGWGAVESVYFSMLGGCVDEDVKGLQF